MNGDEWCNQVCNAFVAKNYQALPIQLLTQLPPDAVVDTCNMREFMLAMNCNYWSILQKVSKLEELGMQTSNMVKGLVEHVGSGANLQMNNND
jgi:hypothetical protein